MKSIFQSGTTARRKLLSLIGAAVFGVGSTKSAASAVSIDDWDSDTWEAGTHYWRRHRDGTLFLQYKDYGEHDFVSVQKFSVDGGLERRIVPQMDVASKEEARKILSKYQ
ncbi:hypothetical protein [Halonotius sp. GCM10025705]|uniref:hypothetical protein n=1 Tax=Halonotius sp. GCM10025705 TaxID=3252678 RepID=UPI00361F55A3